MRFQRTLLLMALTMACACGSKSEPAAGSQEPAIKYPAWVEKGSGAFGKEGQKAFYGVGSVSGIKNQALARSTADNRARAELSKVFEVYSASLMKDYMASTTAGDMKASSEEQHVEQAIKTFSAQTLSGVQVVDHWFHPDGTIYSLAKLDLDAMKDLTSKAKELDPKVRDYVRKNAQKSFDALEAQEDKAQGRAAPAPATAAPSTPPPSSPPPAATPAPRAETRTEKLALDDSRSVQIQVVRGEPAVVGCADGQREAFADLSRFPTIAGCLATWKGTVSLRQAKTGGACGNNVGPCAAPSDACAQGWHVCASDGQLTDLASRVSAAECEQAAAGGSFVAGASHCQTQSGCVYGPADAMARKFSCFDGGWCSEPICCGPGCGTGSCPSGLWPEATHIAIGTDQGCNRISSTRAGGILCCKD